MDPVNSLKIKSKTAKPDGRKVEDKSAGATKSRTDMGGNIFVSCFLSKGFKRGVRGLFEIRNNYLRRQMVMRMLIRWWNVRRMTVRVRSGVVLMLNLWKGLRRGRG